MLACGIRFVSVIVRLLNDATLKTIKELIIASTYDESPLWQTSVREGAPERIEGKEFIINQSMEDLHPTYKPVLFADFKRFAIREVLPLKVIRLDERFADTDETAFAVKLVLVYYHYNHGYIKSRNLNPGIEYPHIVMENEDTNKLHYVTVKAAIHPDIPEPLPPENYSTLIKLAEEAKAIPVFIGVTFSNYSTDENSPAKCGGEYIVKITRLKELGA